MADSKKKKTSGTDNPARDNGKAWKKHPKVPKRKAQITPERQALLLQRDRARAERAEERSIRRAQAELDRQRELGEANKKSAAHNTRIIAEKIPPQFDAYERIDD